MTVVREKMRYNRQNGFTLLELIVVIAIIGTIAAFTYPTYTDYILRSYRIDARNMLQEAQQKLEANHTINGKYNELASTGEDINDEMLDSWGLSQSPSVGTIRYIISFVDNPSASEYTLQAVPQGKQTSDECGSFSIDYRNVKKVGSSDSARSELARKCWSN